MRSLRVLFFATRDWYNPATTGGDNTLWEEARYLASVGHRVTYLAARYQGAASNETTDAITVVRLGRVHMLWFWTFVYYMSKCRGKFDVVVTEGFGGSRIPRLAPVYVKEPIITAWHQIHRDLFAAQYPWPLVAPLSLFERMTAWVHRNTYVQAYTQEWKDAFPSIGFAPDKVFVVPPSIRDEWLTQPMPEQHAGNSIVWIGKMRRYKRPDDAIRAMVDVVKAVPEAQLLLIGRHDDLPYESQLQQLVTELGLDENVQFRFNVSEQDKHDLLRNSRVLVVTSAVEGFGIVVLEANAYGVPAVASSRVPESVVRNEVNGLRYSFGDSHQLACSIIRILQNGELRTSLAAGALQYVRGFGWSRVGPQFELAVMRTFEGTSA